MSKINPEPNLIHIMGCYVLGNPNGEKVRLRSGTPRASAQVNQLIRSHWLWIPGVLAPPAGPSATILQPFPPLVSATGFGSDHTDHDVTVFVFLFLSGPTAVPETEEPDEALFCGV